MKWLLIILLTGIHHFSFAQQKREVDYFFLTDTVMTGFGQTFSNKLKVINTTSREITLFRNVENADNVLMAVPDTLKLMPGTTLVFPVKYLAAAKQVYKESFRAASPVLLPDSAVFYVKMDDPDRIRITALEPGIYLDPQTGKVSFPLRCANDGYLPVQISLSLNSYPEGLVFEKQKEILTLAAGSVQIITLSARSLLSKGYAPDFTVNLLATNPEGKVLANTSLRIISLSSTKRLTTGYNQYSNRLNNSVELSYVNLNSDYAFYQLRGQGGFSPGDKSKVDYQLNLNYYPGQHTMDAYDTWLSYSNKYLGVTLGNITENLDYSLYGRGVKTSAFLNEKNSVDLYYVNNNYLLFSGTGPLANSTNTYAASYCYGKPGTQNARVSFIHTSDPYNQLNTNLVNGEVTILSTPAENITLSGGYSYEKNRDSGISKPGYALGGIYTLQHNSWSLNLNNYFSSGYYSGLRRGVIQMEERVRYSLNAFTSVYARYSSFKNDPHYIAKAWLTNNSENQTAIYEVGLSRRIKALSLTLYPYLISQDLTDNYFTGKALHSFSSRAALDLNYSFGKAMFSLNTDYGYTKSNNPLLAKANYSSLKMNLSFSTSHWGLNGSIQTAPYYLQEELMPVEGHKYRQYSFGPYLHVNALKQKMDLSLSSYANYNNYGFGWNNTIDAQVKYRMDNTWQFSGQVFYNTYSKVKSNANTQLRIGVQKSFIAVNAPGLKKLALTFFGDDNANGTQDKGEKLLEGIIVDVSGMLAVSNQKGNVSYSNMAAGEKEIQVKEGKGWQQLAPLKLQLLSNRHLKVPLVKCGRLTGRVVPAAQKYITEKPALEGIRVIATDMFNRNYSSLTDETGNFYFSIPTGRYVIHIETAGQLFSITDARKEITLEEQHNTPVIFQWLDERRKTDIKHF